MESASLLPWPSNVTLRSRKGLFLLLPDAEMCTWKKHFLHRSAGVSAPEICSLTMDKVTGLIPLLSGVLALHLNINPGTTTYAFSPGVLTGMHMLHSTPVLFHDFLPSLSLARVSAERSVSASPGDTGAGSSESLLYPQNRVTHW